MSIWKTFVVCTLVGALMAGELQQATAAPMPTNVSTMKAAVPDDVTEMRRRAAWGWGVGTGLFTGAIIGGAITGGGYYGSPYHGYPGPYYGYYAPPPDYGYGPYYAYPRYYGYRPYTGYYRPHRAYRRHYYRPYW